MTKPAASSPPRAGRYVVLYHEMPPGAERASHWDFMLERGEVLATWAVESPPDAVGPLPAVQLADHRPAYLEYEGALSEGRGRVTQWDAGRFETLIWVEGTVAVSLSGEKLCGAVRLERAEKEKQPTADDQRMAFVFTFSSAD